jgi:hypothetical protein
MCTQRCSSAIILLFIGLIGAFQTHVTLAMVLAQKNFNGIPSVPIRASSSASALSGSKSNEFATPVSAYRWLSVRPFQDIQDPLRPENELGYLLQYLDKRGASELLQSAFTNEEAERDIRSPLGTMRFGKRAGVQTSHRPNDFDKRNNPLGTMRFGKRSGPLGTMRFGKRSLEAEEQNRK